MARKSERLSSSAKATPIHKRAASTTATPSAEAKRSRKATPTKSQYFETQDDVSTGEVDQDDEFTSENEDGSDFGEEADEVQSSGGEKGDDYDSDDKSKSRKKTTPRTGTTSSATIRTKGSEVWRTGVKAGLGPGNQVVIKKPTARPAGKTPYSDETIHPNTLLFLKELKENNDRQWLKMHDPIFRQAEKDWHSFVEKLTERLTEIDDTVPELPVKDIIFRIYRDVRFSSDPTPYKPYFSAAWSRTGRKGPYAHYYVQISPDESFVGGGLWHPESAPTAAMRRNIDHHPERIKLVLMEGKMRKEFLKGAPQQESKVVKAFVASNAGNALKTKPKGYDADHVDIDLLRLRNYTIGKTLTDDELVETGGMDRVAELLTCMKPFITYLNSVVMPDEEPETSEDEDLSGSEVLDSGDDS